MHGRREYSFVAAEITNIWRNAAARSVSPIGNVALSGFFYVYTLYHPNKPSRNLFL